MIGRSRWGGIGIWYRRASSSSDVVRLQRPHMNSILNQVLRPIQSFPQGLEAVRIVALDRHLLLHGGQFRQKNFEVLAGELKRVNFANRVRSFAACCHTPILFQDNEDSEWLDVTIVSLEDPGVYFPAGEIWTEDKLPWIMLNPELPKYPQGKS